MAIYTVHVPRELSDPGLRAERTAFVRDGFSLGAFLYGPLYLLRHRALLAAVLWLVAVLAIGWVNHLLRMPRFAEILLALLIMLFTGLEASSIRRFALHRRGLDTAGVVSARSLDEGETAFFRFEAGRTTSSATSHAIPRVSRPAPTGVIGLFPDSEV